MTSEIEIDIVADFTCPWSHIGTHRLFATLEALELPAKVTWYPYLLQADLPPDGLPRRDWLARTYGVPAQVEKALEELRRAGAADGVEFDFDAIRVQSNTFDAHRLMRWARDAGEGMDRKLAERLFSLFFREGEDIGDVDVLAAAAEEIGLMDLFRARKMLESDLDTEAVWEEMREVHELGVKRLPAFIIGRKYAILGAEDHVNLAKTLMKVQQEAAEAN